MNPPKAVKIGPYTYTVHWTKEDWQKIGSPEDCGGRTENCKHQIHIAPEWDEQARREVLWHEVQHAIWHLNDGVMEKSTVLPDDIEEVVIRLTNTHVLTVLRENPRLVAYLTAP